MVITARLVLDHIAAPMAAAWPKHSLPRLASLLSLINAVDR
jgi:hypothetical protein